jgi:predicted ATPase/class 3 adenylate cyclase
MPGESSTTTNGQATLPAERRQVTALSYDLVGSTRLSDELDPEDMQEVQQSFHNVCTQAVNRLGGYIASYTGDGAMALFGYPRGHEDSAARAIYAGLEIVSECQKLSAVFTARRIMIAVRVGIATGTVVTHRTASERVSFVGIPLNLAFKLQDVTAPNTVLISATTRRLAGRLFEYRAAGSLLLGGLTSPQPAWRAVRPRQFRTRFQGARIHPLTPLMAREAEIQGLTDLWRQSEQGSGQIVLVSGEPGIGKSRLVSAFGHKAARNRQLTIFFQCSALHRDTALYPLVVQLEHFIRRSATDSAEELRTALHALLSSNGVSSDATELVARLLDISSGSLDLPPDINKERTVEALISWASHLSARRPLLIIVEDAHWIDPTSQELLDQFVDRISGHNIMLIITCRPEYQPAWSGKPNVSWIRLDRLSKASCTTIVEKILGQWAPHEVVEQIVQRADGIPLFVEELSTAVLDASSPNGTPEVFSSTAGHVPPSLSDSLIARLDQLGPDKEVAQICSAIGRTFALSILQRVLTMDDARIASSVAQKVSMMDDARVARGIERLVSLGLATLDVDGTDIRYSFRHALIQEAAYESMLRNKRAAVHRRIAEVLERDYRGTREAAPEIVGHHFAEAGLVDRAAVCFHEAGRRAAAASANIEAKRLLERALACVSKTAATPEKSALELSILNSLGPILMTTNGPGSPEVEHAYERALQLCAEVPDGKQQFVAHWGWWRIAPDADELQRRADQLLEVATRLDDLDFKLQAHHCQWATLFNAGHLAECLKHIDLGIEIYERGDYKSHGTLYGGHDPKVCAYGEKALLLWLTGYPDQALQAIEVSLSHAETLRHAGSIGHARDIEIMLLRYRRDIEVLLARTETMVAFAAEQGFRDLSAKALVFKGWALSCLGQRDIGLESMEEGLALQRKLATQEDIPVYLEMLAETHGDGGNPELGIPLLDEAISMVNASGLIYWLAQLYSCKGDLIRKGAGRTIEDAIVWYDRAIETATLQGARSLVLRAAVGRARLLDRSGRRDAGQAALAEIYSTFTEGFNSVDLLEARQLLDGLR